MTYNFDNTYVGLIRYYATGEGVTNIFFCNGGQKLQPPEMSDDEWDFYGKGVEWYTINELLADDSPITTPFVVASLKSLFINNDGCFVDESFATVLHYYQAIHYNMS